MSGYVTVDIYSSSLFSDNTGGDIYKVCLLDLLHLLDVFSV